MANIKRNKGIKGATIAICSIATVALVSVGFATWVIAGSSTISSTGNIQVDVVTDSSYPVILKGWEEDKSDIVFGTPTSEDATSMSHASWLSIENNDKDENLSVTLNFDVCNVKEGDDLSEILSVDFAADLSNSSYSSSSYDQITSVAKNYVSGLPTEEAGTLYLSYQAGGSADEYTGIEESNSVSDSDLQTGSDGSYVSCQATAEFSWGSAFGGKNPYEYSAEVEAYEADSSTSLSGTITSQLQLSQALQQLEADFNDETISFILTITAAAPDVN